MNKYIQITYEERVIIADLWRRKKTYYYIAKYLKRKHETVVNELNRNGEVNKFEILIYHAKKAQKKHATRRKQSKAKFRIIENDFELETEIIEYIKDDWSPEQISGRYKKVATQTIYNYIYAIEDKDEKQELIKHLRRKGKTYRKAKNKENGFTQSITAPKTMISDRPEEINDREKLGDFEGDTVLLNGLERFYTLVDRKSGHLFLVHILNGEAQTIYEETVKLHQKERGKILSITYDNGVEFSYHDLITLDTKIPIYFAFPYHSWERGTNENTNGLIRQYFPKGELYDKITESYVLEIQNKINNRPRKRLNYLTPYEVFVLGKDPKVDGFIKS